MIMATSWAQLLPTAGLGHRRLLADAGGAGRNRGVSEGWGERAGRVDGTIVRFSLLERRFTVDGAPIMEQGQVFGLEGEKVAAAAPRLIVGPADGHPFEMAK